jgi:hypothetical protein
MILYFVICIEKYRTTVRAAGGEPLCAHLRLRAPARRRRAHRPRSTGPGPARGARGAARTGPSPARAARRRRAHRPLSCTRGRSPRAVE